MSRECKIFGKWFFKTNGIREVDSIPPDDNQWDFIKMIPGRFKTITQDDADIARSLGADCIALGKGNKFTPFYCKA